MTERVLNLSKLIGTLDPLSSDFDAARKEIERLDDAELAGRVAGVAEIDQTTNYEIVFDRDKVIDDVLSMYPPIMGEDAGRKGLNTLTDEQLLRLHGRVGSAHNYANGLYAGRVNSTAGNHAEADGTDDNVPFAPAPEELHY